MHLQTNRGWRFQCAAAVTLLLSACGGGGDGSSTVPNLVATSAGDTLTTVLNGQPLTPRSVSLRQTFGTNEVQYVSVDSEYKYNTANDQIEIKIGNITRTLDVSGSDPNVNVSSFFAENVSAGEFAVFEVWNETLNEYASGTGAAKYLIIFNSYVEDNQVSFIDRDIGIIGLETPSTYFDNNTSTATYSGGFMTENYRQAGAATDSRHRLVGTLSLGADFANMQVTGGSMTVEGEYIGSNSLQSRTGNYAIGSGAINSATNSFEIPLTASVPGLTLRSDAKMTGGFYGNTAQEAGGTISYTGTLDGSEVIAGGVFSALKD